MEEGGELYNALVRLRDQLKTETKTARGKAPRICTDDAIAEMVRLRPKKVSDFSTIPGLGKAFIDNFADDFLSVLSRFAIEEGIEKENILMNSSVECALQELEKKLVNISRNNKLLYMPKATNAKEAFDLDILSYRCDPTSALFVHGKRVPLAKPNMKTPEGKKADYYAKLSQLYRNINRIVREKGQNDLYVGYPFVEGCMPGERFDIKAPLVLFPVDLIRTPDSIDLVFDDSRDVVYNNTLILGYFKMNGINKPLPDNILEEVKRENFISTVLSFYEEVGLKISRKGGDAIERFENYRADEFPKYEVGELVLKNNLVIGRLPTYSNSIQKDFIKIVDGQMVNPLLDELLVSPEDRQAPVQAEETEETNEKCVKENDLVYINDLNAAQEEVISMIHDTDRLVIQGPPGTGKSQTITNIIADFASEGKTVLMVSEKKAALDVVYSRLGRLSRYCMLIDDVNNKDLFYRQMDAITHIAHPEFKEGTRTSDSTSSIIQSKFNDFDTIADRIYNPGNFGIEPYKLYLMNRKPDPSNRSELEKYSAFSEIFAKKILDCSYTSLSAIHNRFMRQTLITDMNDCLDMRSMHPWMMDVKPDLNEYDVEMAKNDMLGLKAEISQWKSSGFFSKVFGKGKIKSRVDEVFSKYWTFYRCIDPIDTYIEMDEYLRGLDYYDDFTTMNNMYEALTDCEKMYVDMMHKIVRDEICSPNMVNDELFNFTVLQHIQKFEADNREILKDITMFENLEADVRKLVSEKKDLSRSEIEYRMADYVKAITESKRFGDMQRVIEMKRKWSVNKYIEKFDFELFKGIKVWLLTPDVVSEIIPMDTGLFDLVIFDEASQMFIEKGIPSVMRAKKVVIAGDHKQLRPSKLGAGRIGMDEDDAEDEGEIPIYEEASSLLDVARFKYPSVMLRYHYRSRYEELISFSNHAFYKGRLYVSPNIESDMEPPIMVHKLDNGRWSDRCNKAEAEKVVDLVADIFRTRKEDETVGIITFNSAQMDLVESMLEDRCAADPEFAGHYYTEVRRKENGEDIGLFVKNIENVQGDERDIIIFSIGYAKGDNGRLVRNFGWLNQAGGENRLNVAISRAKKKIHIVTSFSPSELTVEDMKNDGPKLLKLYLQYCFAVSDGNRMAAEGILRSLNEAPEVPADAAIDDRFEDMVFSTLKSRGLDVVRDVGIGGYTIDIAVRRNGRFVLGIECDGKLYHSRMNTRERDWHRRRYLESRGWNMYRVWSPSWWRNPQAEADRIVEIAGSTES